MHIYWKIRYLLLRNAVQQKIAIFSLSIFSVNLALSLKYLSYKDVPYTKRLHFAWPLSRYLQICSKLYSYGDIQLDSRLIFFKQDLTSTQKNINHFGKNSALEKVCFQCYSSGFSVKIVVHIILQDVEGLSNDGGVVI